MASFKNILKHFFPPPPHRLHVLLASPVLCQSEIQNPPSRSRPSRVLTDWRATRMLPYRNESFTSSTYRSSGAQRTGAVVEGWWWGHLYQWPSNLGPATPHLHTMASASRAPLLSCLINIIREIERRPPHCSRSPPRPPPPHPLSARALFLAHSPTQVLQCRAIEVALNGTHSTQREYKLTTG